MLLERDFAKLIEKMKKAHTLVVDLPCLDSHEESFCHGAIMVALSQIGLESMQQTVRFVVTELLQNAEVAVMRRFCKDFPETHDPGVLSQKSFDSFRMILKNQGPQIQFQVRLEKDILNIRIVDKAPVSDADKKHLDQSFAIRSKSVSFSDIADAKKKQSDSNQGIAIAGLSLRRAGISDQALNWFSDAQSTTLELNIEKSKIRTTESPRADDEIIHEIDTLPAIPESIRRLMQVCSSLDSSAKEIAKEVESDPGIAGQMLKVANSPGFTGGKVNDIAEAVKVIGIRGIMGMLMGFGANRILQQRYRITQEHAKHSTEVARYARLIARKFKMNSYADSAYLGGLLHDIGELIIAVSTKHLEEFEMFSSGRDLSQKVNLEELAFGTSHGKIGAQLAAKWHFPADICAAMAYHHSPEKAPEEHRRLVDIVYIANIIAERDAGNVPFFGIEPSVLSRFGLTTPESFDLFSAAIQNDLETGLPKG